MKDFFRQNGGLLLVIALLLSVLLGLGSTVLAGNTDPISNLMTTITSPFRNGAAAVADWGEGVYRYVARYGEIEEELALLREQVTQLEEQVRQGQDASRENQQLRELLNLQAKHQDFVFESARVASRSTSNWESTLTISKGSGDGVEVGDCAVTETGRLVGIISSVTHSTATVSTIINTDIEIGGTVGRTNSFGILEGDFALMTQDRLRLSYLYDDTQMVAGDEVLTSGLGQVYPAGLVVGRVEAVFTDASGMTKYAVVIPDVVFEELVEVFVIKDFDIVE